MNNKVLVVGLGVVGRAITFYLNRLNELSIKHNSIPLQQDRADEYEIHGMDPSPMAMLNTQQLLPPTANVTLHGPASFNRILKDVEPALVISALPYHKNVALAILCAEGGIAYLDLGGSNTASESINAQGGSFNQLVMTDLGVAPGLINIWAEQAVEEQALAHPGLPLHSIAMFVGGLPVNRDINPLRYTLNWSPEGLINEYVEDTFVLENGEIVVQKGMANHKHMISKNLGALEAFNTSGGVATTLELMKNRGVKHCSYQTLRYPGHHAMASFLINDCSLDTDALTKIFSATPPVADLIIMILKTRDQEMKENVREEVFYPQNGMSAMQVLTAVPVVAVADLILKDIIPRDIGRPLTYADVPIEEFNMIMESLLQ